MKKFKRSERYKGRRAWFKRFDIKNPASPAWRQAGGRPKVSTGPSEECFDSDGVWMAVKEGMLVRVTGEPEIKPKYVVIERRQNDVELRLYYLGNDYFFVQLYYCIGKEFISIDYRGRDAALRAYSNGGILWRSQKRLEMKLLSVGEFER